MFQTVVVPLDGSAFGECALPLALTIARRAGAMMRLVRVAPPLEDVLFWAPLPGSAVEHEIQKELRSDAMAYLQEVGRRLGTAAPSRMGYSVPEGDAAESLRADISDSHADLVVMASRGRGALGRIWLGSVADELIRSLNIPVLIVRPEEEAKPPDLLRESLIRRMLLAVDGSTLAEKMLSPAVALARLMDAECTLLRVVGATDHFQFSATVSAEVAILKDRVFQEAEEYLQRLAIGIRSTGVRIRTRSLRADQPAAGILAESSEADLIALATHGRHGLSRLLMGSVADKVVRGSSVPVLVCRDN